MTGNDLEYAMFCNQASSAGGSTTARSMGSIESWIPTTDNSGNEVQATTTAAASTASFSSGHGGGADRRHDDWR